MKKNNQKKAGRKNKYETHVKPYLNQIREWAANATEKDIAKNLGIALSTLNDYKNKHSELQQAIMAGQRDLVMDLKSALIQSTKPQEYEESTITKTLEDGSVMQVKKKYLPMNTGAAIFLLKNLDKENWADNWHNIDIKKEELELKKKLAEHQINDW